MRTAVWSSGQRKKKKGAAGQQEKKPRFLVSGGGNFGESVIRDGEWFNSKVGLLPARVDPT